MIPTKFFGKTVRHGKNFVTFDDKGVVINVQNFSSINQAKKANRTTKYPVLGKLVRS
jgi:hypothetical protein